MAVVGETMAKCLQCFGPCAYDPYSARLHDHYRIGKLLGKGSYGEVRAARLRFRSHHHSKRVVKKGASTLNLSQDNENCYNDSSASDAPCESADSVNRSLANSGKPNSQETFASQGSKDSRTQLPAPARQSRTSKKSKDSSEKDPDAVHDAIESVRCVADEEVLESGEIIHSLHRRADTNRDHYIQGRLDWPYACKILRRKLLEKEQSAVDALDEQITKLETIATMLSEAHTSPEEVDSVQMELKELRKKKQQVARSHKVVSKEKVLKELKLLAQCRCAYVLYLVEAFEDDHYMYVIVERCYGDFTTRQQTNPVACSVVQKYAYQLLSAAAHIHCLNVVHRDIKPENVLFKSPREDADVVLGDFGMAMIVASWSEKITDIAGSAAFMAPETWKLHFQCIASDMWATGISLFNMITAQLPFHPGSHPSLLPERLRKDKHKKENSKSDGKREINASRQTFNNFCDIAYKLGKDGLALAHIVTDERAIPRYSHCDEGAKSLMEQLLSRDHEKRITATDALERHPWMVEYRKNLPEAERSAALQQIQRRSKIVSRQNSGEIKPGDIPQRSPSDKDSVSSKKTSPRSQPGTNVEIKVEKHDERPRSRGNSVAEEREVLAPMAGGIPADGNSTRPRPPSDERVHTRI